MKILQLNIWGGRLGKQIVELLDREKPDVVCLQEAVMFPGIENLFISPLEEITVKAGYDHTFFSASFAFKMMRRNADWGNAILSKTPFLYQYAEFTRGQFEADFDILDGDYNMRNLQHVIVEKEGKKVHVLNHHGHHLDQHKNGDEETLRQCKLIVDYIQKLEGSVILTGDFNLSPNSESLELLNAVLTNQCLTSSVTTTRTVLTYKTEVCDYIFTSPDLKVTRFEVLPDITSDHAALVVEVG
jgi:endonuclease/exonuclease/phosphatase family metal-dependent hydrolase